MTNITIANNEVEGRESLPVRLRMFDIDTQSGNKVPTDIVFDIAPGEEHRVNIVAPGTGFEIRPIVEGASFASEDKVVPDAFGINDAFVALKKAVLAIPAIRNDMTLSQADRDAKAGAAWSEALRLAQQ